MTLIEFLLVGGVPVVLSLLGVTLYFHRAGAHSSMWLHPAVGFCFRWIIATTSGMKLREWVAVHRQHHDLSDKQGDPHSPQQDGFWTVFFGNAWLFRKALRDNPNILSEYAQDVPVYACDRLRWRGPALVLPVIQLIVMVLLGSTWSQLLWLPLASGITIISFLLAGGIVNAIGHMAKDESTVGDYSKDLGPILRLLTIGEGLHRFHHERPNSPKMGDRWWSIDPGWWVFCTLRSVGLAKVERLVPMHPS